MLIVATSKMLIYLRRDGPTVIIIMKNKASDITNRIAKKFLGHDPF